MSAWDTVFMDVEVVYTDIERAIHEATERGEDTSVLTVEASVDIQEALDEATDDQLRAALDTPEYTPEQLDAIRDCFAALAGGDAMVAVGLLGRIFGHKAQVQAAEYGIRDASFARAA